MTFNERKLKEHIEDLEQRNRSTQDGLHAQILQLQSDIDRRESEDKERRELEEESQIEFNSNPSGLNLGGSLADELAELQSPNAIPQYFQQKPARSDAAADDKVKSLKKDVAKLSRQLTDKDVEIARLTRSVQDSES